MSRPIAFVLTQDAPMPNVQSLIEALRQRHPDRPWELTEDSSNNPASPFLRCGNRLVALMAIDAPVPNDETVWARAAMSWPEAREAAARHRAHVIVSLLGANESALDDARMTSAVVGGLVAATPGACGVIWAGNTARSPRIWLDMSRNAFAPYPDYPFMLWVDIAPFRGGQQAVGASTFGLSSFVGREIEFEVPGIAGPPLIQRVAGLACHLIEHGHRVKDGDTIGGSEAERIKVHHRISRLNGAPVLRIGLDASASNPLKQYPIIAPATARDHPLLLMLTRVGLFDASGADNQVQLQPGIHRSEQRLESYDQGVTGFLSNILASDAYVEADKRARTALARGDSELARSALRPFAQNVGQFLAAARNALEQRKLFMFPPKQ